MLGSDLDKKIVDLLWFHEVRALPQRPVWAKELGYTNVYRAPGGITAWKDLGYSYKVVPNDADTYPNK